MTYFESIFLGLIQGITEFLPISSTGHLWIAEHFILNTEPSIALEAAFHFATVIAVIAVFWKQIWTLFIGIFQFQNTNDENFQLAWKLIFATGITGILGILGKPYLEHIISADLVAGTLLITAFFVLVSEYFSPQKESSFSWNLAFWLGMVQSIAIIPGISRSGATIVFLLLVGIAKTKSLEISFLLSIPTILASFVFMLPELQSEQFEPMVLLTGGIVACITAFITIKVMMHYIQKIWKWFALWCVIVALGIYFLT